MNRKPKLLSGPALSRVSARCEVSPSTVRRYLAGERVTVNNRRAIERALHAEGLAHLIPAEPATAA